MPNLDGIASALQQGVSKRSLFRAASGALTLSMLSGSARDALASEIWDVIVIGGGTAGMPVAIFAAEAGAKVLVIDKAPVLGGTLDRSTGQMAAAGSVFQKAKSIADSPDDHYADIMRINANTSDPVLTRLLVDNAADTINWLARNGFKAMDNHPVRGAGHEFFKIPRYLWGKDGGRTIFATMEPLLQQGVKAGRITVFTSTGAVDLIQDKEGAVLGVVAEDDKGKRTDFRGQSVVLSAGGCAANPTMYHELHGSPMWCDVAYPFSQGEGLMLGLGAGGRLRGGELYAGLFGTVLQDKAVASPREERFKTVRDPRPVYEIFVNSHGERFVQEDHPSVDHRERAICRQPGQRCWAIFDEGIMATAPSIYPNFAKDAKTLGAFNTHPMLFKAPNLRELGVRAGIDPAGLQAAVANYNATRQGSGADAFGRQERPMAIDKGPFYAVRLQSWTVITFAGLAVDGRLRVTRKADGQPVPNLYAVGEIIGAGATSGGAYTNGMMVTPALTFGRLLGTQILPLKRGKASTAKRT